MDTVDDILKPIINNPNVLKMKNNFQHGKVTTFKHCYDVAVLCHKINKKINLVKDEKNLVLGAFLHDFFLYDWHNIKYNGFKNLHGFKHASIASNNAKRILNMNDKICDIIKTHMWPLNITSVPKSREAWLVCIIDKFISLKETLFNR